MESLDNRIALIKIQFLKLRRSNDDATTANLLSSLLFLILSFVPGFTHGLQNIKKGFGRCTKAAILENL